MKVLKKDDDTPMFVPDFMAISLFDIDFEELRKRGIEYIAFDADSTLVSYRAKKLHDKTKTFLQKELKIFKGVCIASNRVTNDLHDIASDLDADMIRASLTLRKPAKGFFERVINHFNIHPAKIAMIGDKLVADIYGANRMGLTTVWVEKMGTDSIFDRIFHTRQVEMRMMKKYITE